MNSFTVVGESIADVISRHAGPATVYPGGSPLSVAVALARLGQPTSLVSEIGQDVHGQMLHRHLAASGVDTTGVQAVPTTTNIAAAEVGADGQADYNFQFAWTLS